MMPIEQIRPHQVNAWMAKHPGAVLLDVREPWEVRTATVAESPALAGQLHWHVPMQAVPAHAVSWSKDTPIACLCHHGGRSQNVAMFLSQSGFQHVANVAGGIHAWAHEVDASVPQY